MTNTTKSTTVNNIGVVMFTVADQDAALTFYTDVFGYEVRSDTRFGPNEEYRWLEVAPPGSTARLALNPPMEGSPGGGAMGVETPDLKAEHARLSALGGVDLDPLGDDDDPATPAMFMMRDLDGNNIVVVEV
ncbi:MAG: VOC family protein [Rhodococcus sp. (in: high G+C Gram-positive bacteria)]